MNEEKKEKLNLLKKNKNKIIFSYEFADLYYNNYKWLPIIVYEIKNNVIKFNYINDRYNKKYQVVKLDNIKIDFFRINTYSVEEKSNYKFQPLENEFFEMIRNLNLYLEFNLLIKKEPYDIIQNIRGKLLYFVEDLIDYNDIFSYQEYHKIIEFFKLIIKFLKNYLEFISKDLEKMIIKTKENKYLQMVSTKLAIFSIFPELSEIIMLILGKDKENSNLYNNYKSQFEIKFNEDLINFELLNEIFELNSKIILQILENENKIISFKLLTYLYNINEIVIDNLNIKYSQYQEKMNFKLHFKNILKLEDDMIWKINDLNDILLLIKIYENLIKNDYKNFGLFKKIESIKIKKNFLFLKKGTLEKKLISINNLNYQISILKNSTLEKIVIFKNNLIKNNFFEIIFGEYYHEEIIKKSSKILEYLADFLTKEDIYKIYNYMNNAYPDKLFFIIKILKQIKNKINQGIIEDFIISIEDKKISDLNENLLDLIFILNQNNLEENNSLNKLYNYQENNYFDEKIKSVFFRTFKYFWSILMKLNEIELSETNKLLKIKLINLISCCIKNDLFKYINIEYFKHCLLNIKVKNDINDFLKIFNDILLSFNKYLIKDINSWDEILKIINKNQFIWIFFNLINKLNNDHDIIFYFKIFENLILILKEKFLLEKEYFSKFWKNWIQNNLNKIILKQFINLIDKYYFEIFYKFDILNNYFKVDIFDYKNFSKYHFKIFNIIFIKENQSKNYLRQSKHKLIFIVENFENIIGLDILFNFLINNKDENISKNINFLLIQIFKFSFDKKLDILNIKFKYLLNKSIELIKDYHEKKEINGIENICLFFNNYINNLKGISEHSIKKSDGEKKFYFIYKKTDLKLKLPLNKTLLYLKNEIEIWLKEKFNKNLSIIINYKNKDFKESLFYEENIVENFEIKSINFDIKINKNKEVDTNLIKLYISKIFNLNKDIFEILFELINNNMCKKGVLDFLVNFTFENKIINDLIRFNKNDNNLNKIFNNSNLLQIKYIYYYLNYKFKQITNWIKKIDYSNAFKLIYKFFENHQNDNKFNDDQIFLDMLDISNHILIKFNFNQEYNLKLFMQIIKTLLNSKLIESNNLFQIVFETFIIIIKKTEYQYVLEINDIINSNLFNPNIKDNDLFINNLKEYFEKILSLKNGKNILITISKSLIDKIKYDEINTFLMNMTLISNILSLFEQNKIDKNNITKSIKFNYCLIKLFGFLKDNKNLKKKDQKIKTYIFYNIDILLINIIDKKDFVDNFEEINQGLIHKFIHNNEDSFNVICENIKEREIFYEILKKLINILLDIKYYDKVIDIINEINNVMININRDNSVLDWKRKYQKECKIKEKGLLNLGTTCYMNSLIQHLYHCKPFKDNLLKFEYSNNDKILNSLKKLFILMEHSKSKYINPIFLFSLLIHPETKKNLNPNEQMDIEEFFLSFTTELENELEKYNLKDLFDYIFGGRIAHIIECQICKKENYKDEKYLSLNLQVKNMKHLENSLNLFTKGELLDGDNKFFCENCNQKQPVIKRDMILKLPNVMILILKRIDFDLNTLQNLKLNDYWEFDKKIDMKNYLYHNNKEKETNYNLKGFTIHQGIATSGHYFSIIKNNNKWKEYNDTKIKEFNLENLEEIAFGSSGNNYKSSSYILIYEKNNYKINDDKFNYKTEATDLLTNNELYNFLILNENKENIKNIFVEKNFSDCINFFDNFENIKELKPNIFKLNLLHFLLLKMREDKKKNNKLYNYLYEKLNDWEEINCFLEIINDISILNEFLLENQIYIKRILFKNLIWKTINTIYNKNVKFLMNFEELFSFFINFLLLNIKNRNLKWVKEIIEIINYFAKIDQYRVLKNIIIKTKLVDILANLIDRDNTNTEIFLKKVEIITEENIKNDYSKNYNYQPNLKSNINDFDIEINYKDIIKSYIILIKIYFIKNLNEIVCDNRLLEKVFEENKEKIHDSESTIKSVSKENIEYQTNLNENNYFISIFYNENVFSFILKTVLLDKELTNLFTPIYNILLIRNKDIILELLNHIENILITNNQFNKYIQIKNLFSIINSSINTFYEHTLKNDLIYFLNIYFKYISKIQINPEKNNCDSKKYYEILMRQLIKFYLKNDSFIKKYNCENHYYTLISLIKDINDHIKKLNEFFWNNQEFINGYDNLEIFNYSNKKKLKKYEKTKKKLNEKRLWKIKNQKYKDLDLDYLYDSDDELDVNLLKENDTIEKQKQNEVFIYELGKVIYNWENILCVKLENYNKKILIYNLETVNKGCKAFREFNFK